MVPFPALKKLNDKFSFIVIILLIPVTFHFLNSHSLFARGFEFKPGAVKSEIPFQNINGLVVIPFRLGKEDINLVLDTGIRNIVLFDKSGSYGLKPETGREILFSGIGNESLINGKLVSEVKIESRQIEGSGLAVILIPQNDIFKNLKPKVNGLIGYDIFSKFLVSIDYKKNLLILIKPQDFTPLENYQQMDLKLIDTKPYIEPTLNFDGINKETYKFFIDSGAGYDIMLNQPTGFKNKKKKKLILGKGLTGEFQGQFYFAHNFILENFYFNNLNILIPTSGTYTVNDLMDERDGTLGGKFLERFEKVIFDYSNNKIYFKANHLIAIRDN